MVDAVDRSPEPGVDIAVRRRAELPEMGRRRDSHHSMPAGANASSRSAMLCQSAGAPSSVMAGIPQMHFMRRKWK
jgi:hypothetical protein